MARSILQVHPTLRCNLRCVHCYSGSSPDEHGGLALDLVAPALTDAAALGYGVLAVSGGEPLLYRPLPDLLAAAADAGLVTTITTNGLLLGSPRFEACAPWLGGVAVSLDGTGPTHDRVRARRGAFDATVAAMAGLADTGIPFGIVFTLTEESWDQIEDVAALAVDLGAALLQVHPLERSGRGAGCDALVPTATTLNRAYLVVAALRAELGDRIRLQLDLLHRRDVEARPDLVYAEAPRHGARLGDWLATLVVEEDGTVVPVTYGVGRRFRVGRLGEGSLVDAAARWEAHGRSAFTSSCAALRSRLLADPGWRLVNWTEAVVGATVGSTVTPTPAA